MKKYEETDGVWRTVRGRRIFIRKGEDLASAMKRSGKFDNLKREDVQKAKKQLKVDEAKEKWNKEYDTKNYSNPKYKDEKEREKLRQRQDKANKNLEKAYADRDDFMATYDDNRDEKELSWQDKVAKNTREANKKADEILGKRGKGEYMFYEDKWQDDYYGTFREKEEKNARVKEEPDDAPYESVKAYKSFKEKADKLDQTNKTWTGAEYTNDEFMEHLTDANWHTERQMIEEAGLTNKQLRELKKNVKLDRYGVDLDKEKTQKLIDKVKKEFPSDEEKIKAFKEKKQSNNAPNKYKETKRIGFGGYNNDDIPVYNNQIDYTGDFTRANLSKLSNEELTTALNKQTELYKNAVNEKLGDQRTRNGKMDKIFNTAKQQQYDKGSSLLLKEMEKRNLPKFNIYDEKNGMLLVSAPTQEIANRQLKEMYETDKKLQKSYGWKELPKYRIEKKKGK